VPAHFLVSARPTRRSTAVAINRLQYVGFNGIHGRNALRSQPKRERTSALRLGPDKESMRVNRGESVNE
jgi:hypothetical protein